MMWIRMASVILLSILCMYATGQNNKMHKNIIFSEYFSKGPQYSLNYERVFDDRSKVSWSYRVGGSLGKDGIGVPLGINLFTGKSQHHAELSLVAIPYVDNFQSFLSKEDFSDKYLYVVNTVGYRYQKPQGRLFIKGAAGPMIFLDPPSDYFWRMDGKLYFIASFSLGVSF